MCYLIRQDDIYIVREANSVGDQVTKLLSIEGDLIHEFPADWTDEDVLRALHFANIAYEKGFQFGKFVKTLEIKKVLDIE